MTTTECKYYRDKDKECDVWGIPCEMKDCYFKELKRLEQENERLKEEVKIKDNISEKFRREALSWANIANEYQKDKTKLKQTLQEIKEIADEWMNNDWSCFHCRSNMDEKLKEILDLITKVEEQCQ